MKTNIQEIRERIGNAAKKSGRLADAVRLVAVTKYADANSDIYDALLSANCTDFAESRVQSLLEKIDVIKNPQINWHFIGPLQRNKARRILQHVTLIHSVDGIRLAESLHKIALEDSLPSVSVLLEVNVSGEATKHGFTLKEMPAALQTLATFSKLRIFGLMCMSGLHSNDDEIRREFASVKKLQESLIPYCGDNSKLDILSMGMSSDFEIAIEEGATLVRIGSALTV